MRTWWLPCILVVAGALRLGWVLLVPNAQYSDSVWYDAAAANLASNGVYGPDQPSAWFPPGYPLFLAAIYKLVGHSELAGKLGNVAIALALTGFTYLLGRVLLGSTVGLVSAGLIAVWPNLIFHTGILSSDLLAACGFVAAMWLGMRPSRRSAAVFATTLVLGSLIGWMVLVRPVSLILLVSLALWWWLSTRSAAQAFRRLVPVVAVVALIVGAWTIRNYRQFGEVITIATNGGYNFWQTNHRFADGNDTYWPFVPLDDPEYHTMYYGDELTRNREGYRYAIDYLRAHPGHILTMAPTKLFWLYHTDTSGFYEGALYPPMQASSPLADFVRDHERLVEALTFRYYETLMVLSIVGIAIAAIHGRQHSWLWSIVTLPVLLTFFHLFFHAKDRFHIPLDGVVALFAAVAIVGSVRLVTDRSWTRQRRASVPELGRRSQKRRSNAPPAPAAARQQR